MKAPINVLDFESKRPCKVLISWNPEPSAVFAGVCVCLS